MREHVRELVHNARLQPQTTLGAEAVRLARIAAAVHAAQAAGRIANLTPAQAPAALQEQHR